MLYQVTDSRHVPSQTLKDGAEEALERVTFISGVGVGGACGWSQGAERGGGTRVVICCCGGEGMGERAGGSP